MNLKKFTKGMIGDNWKDERNKLYQLKSGKGTKPRAEVEADVPDRVDPEQWRRYLAWRMSELGRLGKGAVSRLGHSKRLATRLGAYL